MHPSPCADTSSPCVPSLRVSIVIPRRPPFQPTAHASELRPRARGHKYARTASRSNGELQLHRGNVPVARERGPPAEAGQPMYVVELARDPLGHDPVAGKELIGADAEAHQGLRIAEVGKRVAIGR